jgi:microcompartment protein CcmL/EutN
MALGTIETVGLAAAIEAADTAVKSANVKLIGYELTKGGGLVTVKFEGEVGAVNAAIKAGCAAAERVSKVWGKLVIPRPHSQVEKIIFSHETVKNQKKINEFKKARNLDENKNDEISKSTEEKEVEKKEEKDSNEVLEIEEICNLCGDPKCPRRKGELRTKCIHYDEQVEDNK